MSLPEPTYEAGALHGWRLVTATGAPLADLPGTLRPTTPLGAPRNTSFERPPFSTVWTAVGDDLPTEPPALTLTGTWEYASADEALADMARIQSAVTLAAALFWRERLYCELRPDRAGLYLPGYNERARSVTHVLNLYPTVTLTPEVLAANQQLTAPPPPPPPGPLDPAYLIVFNFTGVSSAPVTITYPGGTAYVGTVYNTQGVSLEAGQTYTLQPGAIGGYATPAPQTLTLTANTSVSFAYSPSGSTPPPGTTPPPDTGYY